MTFTVFLVVLFAAALHATWNAIVKGSGDTVMSTTLVTGWAAALAAMILPWLPGPDPTSWPFIATSACLQIVYFVLVARIYRTADMGVTYPVMRGAAPLIVSLVSLLTPHASLPPIAWLGIGVICAGILSTVGQRRLRSPVTAWALLNAAVIATYTLVDGAGVRRSGAPAAYTLWIFLLTGAPLLGWTLIKRRSELVRHLTGRWRVGMVAGAGTVGSYGLALWAMTTSSVALVAALRETAILFAIAIARVVLKERISRWQVAGATAIATGAVLIRLA